MDTDNILDFNEEKDQLRMAGFGMRLAAILIDGVILVTILMIVMLPLIKLFQGLNFNAEDISDGLAIGFVLTYFIGLPLISILYPAIFEASKFQGTPGKMAVKIKVTDIRGNKVSFLRAFGRNAGKILSGLIFYIGYLMPLWTKHQQALHDIMADTYVVHKN